jgi:phenylalanyl-tRNA synthetase beta chain
MRVPISWLKDYIDVDIPLEELTRKLTMAGIEVSSIETIGDSWSSIFVGEVIELAPHPNADRLKLATVNFGKEPVSVVCGAPNISRGQRVAFAMTGANLIDPDTHEST